MFETRSEFRYTLRLPVQVSARSNGMLTAPSENIRAHGILLRAEALIPEKNQAQRCHRRQACILNQGQTAHRHRKSVAG